MENLNAAGRLLELKIADSSERWVHKTGVANPPSVDRTYRRPMRPATMLERLRPKDEKSVKSPIEHSVYFGTNRDLIIDEDGEFEFGSTRSSYLHLGLATVTIPETHQFGSKGKMWIRLQRYWNNQYPGVKEIQLFEGDESFRESLQKRIGLFGSETHNLLFVHGFNVTFEKAVFQAAYFGVDLKVPGATFLYSWPSVGQLSSYAADEATVEASVPKFEEFIRKILICTGDDPLTIVVHSMGNRAVLRLLESICQDSTLTIDGRIRNLIFAAPDVDSEVFKNSFDRFSHIPSRSTLYASRGDLAVQSSEWLHRYPRAGLCPPVLVLHKLDTVVVEGVDILDLGHGYYASASEVLHDMFILLHYNYCRPEKRPGLIEGETSESEKYWKLSV